MLTKSNTEKLLEKMKGQFVSINTATSEGSHRGVRVDSVSSEEVWVSYPIPLCDVISVTVYPEGLTPEDMLK